jgi:hypothetical protein
VYEEVIDILPTADTEELRVRDYLVFVLFRESSVLQSLGCSTRTSDLFPRSVHMGSVVAETGWWKDY